jgi:hypothetical protein
MHIINGNQFPSDDYGFNFNILIQKSISFPSLLWTPTGRRSIEGGCGSQQRRVGETRLDGLRLSLYPGRVWWPGCVNKVEARWAGWLAPRGGGGGEGS